MSAVFGLLCLISLKEALPVVAGGLARCARPSRLGGFYGIFLP